MIPLHIQELVKRACTATAIQGRPAQDSQGACKYTDEHGNHCAVGHALTPAQLERLGHVQDGVRHICLDNDDVRNRLGVDPYGCGIVAVLWSSVQYAHDGTGPRVPMGVSWARMFWSRARNRCLQYGGFDLGAFPRHLVGEAQA